MRGIASGIFFMAFFGAVWGLLGLSFLTGGARVIAWVVIALVTLGFCGVGGALLRHARALPETASAEDAAEGRRIGRWFGIVFGVESGLIALASVLLGIFQAGQYIAPVVALIVGLHFFPLAPLFRVPAYYGTGALLVVLALIALVALLLGVPLGSPSPDNWSSFVGVGAALILWATALAITRFGLRVMRRGA
ncbi:MAG TPA: hypothetical protein VFW96_01440 [Thermomicrobiales bacterium]|nr:hypothetical protein [Thermomicrobiales bacterium]